ncbi:MAG: hypothetical protein CMJ78_25275 [Planctomycetaceae bacterium]|nr:hypothetical protein [Planctomycetaceae bacterium]
MNRDELYELFSAYLSEQATDEQIDQLNDIVRSEKAAARMLVEMSDTHMRLGVDESLWMEDRSTAAVHGNAETNQPVRRRGVRPSIEYVGWLTAAIAICVSCLQWFSGPSVEQSEMTEQQPSPVTQLHAAIIKQQIDAEWADNAKQFDTGKPLDGQLLNLEAGIVQIEFGSSAQLVNSSAPERLSTGNFNLRQLSFLSTVSSHGGCG